MQQSQAPTAIGAAELKSYMRDVLRADPSSVKLGKTEAPCPAASASNGSATKFNARAAVTTPPDRAAASPAAAAGSGDAGRAGGRDGGAAAQGAPPPPPELCAADESRERGNARFKAGEYEAAVECYTASIGARPTCLGHANKAMAELKLGRYADAERDCTAAIALDPGYVKAYQRRGAARRALGDLAAAVEDFEHALRLEPGNKATAAERRECVELWMAQQGFSGAEPDRVAVAQEAHVEARGQRGAHPPAHGGQRGAHPPAHGGGGDLLRPVSTAAVNSRGHGAQQPRMEVVQEAAATDVDHANALPPLPAAVQLPMLRPAAAAAAQGQPAAAPQPAPLSEAPARAAAAAAQAAGTPPAAASQPAPPPAAALRPPRTGIDFEKTWKSLRNDSHLQSAYLRLIPPPELPALLKQALTPSLLASLLYALLGTAVEEAPEKAIALLESLPQVPRFDVNMMSLTAKQRAVAAAAWEAAAEGLSSAGLGRRLAKARGLYKM